MSFSANKRQSRVSSALSSAFLEWIMLVMLLIHTLYSYMVSKFARLCDLKTPCPLCAQLDNVLGNKKSHMCVDLICERHKLEISALLNCHSQPAHVDLCGLRTTSIDTSTSQEKTNGATCDFDTTQRVDEQCFSDQTESFCCFEPRIFDSCAEESTERMLSGSKKDSNEGLDECNAENVALLGEEVKSSSNAAYSGNEEAIADDGMMIEALDLLKDSTEDAAPATVPSPETIRHLEPDNVHRAPAEYIKESDEIQVADDTDIAYSLKLSESLSCKDCNAEMANNCLVMPSEAYLKSGDTKVADEAERADIKKPSEESSCTENDVDITNYGFQMPSSGISEPSESVSVEELRKVALQVQAGSPDDVAPESLSKNLTEEDESPSHPESEYVSQIPSFPCISEITCDPQILLLGDATTNDEHLANGQSTADPGTLQSAQMSLSDAYNLAISKRSKSASPKLTDVIVGKDSSTVHEELRLLISHLSAARGIESTWNEITPSPRSHERGDDIVVQNITQSLSIERNPSGLESLGSSIISEIEGESTVDRLKRQIELDRKSISLLCRELEEERSASAVAASQALAMITRLQEEKAAVQMEALQYQRMMEEQAEYDHQTLEKSNEMLNDCEHRLKEVELELEEYKRNINSDELPAIPELAEINTDLVADRECIRDHLRKLEQKLHSFSNNTSISDLAASAADNQLHTTEMVKVNDLSAIQEQLWDLERRLKTLEADHNFLEHSINLLRNGTEGVRLIQEIAGSLRQLRRIGIHSSEP